MVQPLLSLYVIELIGSLEQATVFSGFVFAVSGIASVVASPFWIKLDERESYSEAVVIAGVLIVYLGLWMWKRSRYGNTDEDWK
ncbi:hypothetical protein [Paenibacillus sp. sgz302251]|uniref:hypothetical protein n=1 Tax=Paenibacillus sp. sgz302251 TaxID=3414493 RepID=UPI003C7CD563